MTDGSRERRIAIVDLLVLVVVVLALSLVSQSVSREEISFSLDRARLMIATAVRIVDAKDIRRCCFFSSSSPSPAAVNERADAIYH